LISAIAVALTALGSSIGPELRWVILAFNIITFLCAGVVTTLNGFVKIFGWDEKLKELTKFVQRLDSEWFVFETELNIPPAQRQDGTDFIKRADGNYMHLMQQCPPITAENYIAANKKYQERLFENFAWQQKFKQRIEELKEIKTE